MGRRARRDARAVSALAAAAALMEELARLIASIDRVAHRLTHLSSETLELPESFQRARAALTQLARSLCSPSSRDLPAPAAGRSTCSGRRVPCSKRRLNAVGGRQPFTAPSSPLQPLCQVPHGSLHALAAQQIPGVCLWLHRCRRRCRHRCQRPPISCACPTLLLLQAR